MSSELRVLIGYSPDERGDDALALAAEVARTAKAALTVASVHPPAWPVPGPGAVDAEWLGYLKEESRAALKQAADRLAGAGLPKSRVRYRVHTHQASGRGLQELAAQLGAGMVVIGSAPQGRAGRIAIGSTADQLLHGSPVPVLLAPRGYAERAPERFDRLTVAYRPRHETDLGLRAAVRLAGTLGLPIRLLTMVLRPVGLPLRLRSGEDSMQRQHEQAAMILERAAEQVEQAERTAGGPAPAEVETAISEGTGVRKALMAVDWTEGELLVCMSTGHGPLRRVFLGDTSGKIVRGAPVPVLVLPHATLREAGALAG